MPAAVEIRRGKGALSDINGSYSQLESIPDARPEQKRRPEVVVAELSISQQPSATAGNRFGNVILGLLVRGFCTGLRLGWLAVPISLAVSMPPGLTDSVADLLARKEQRLESLWAEYWLADYRAAQGDPSASTRRVQSAIRSELTDASFVRALQAARFPDRLLERRRTLFLDEAARAQVAGDPSLAKLVEEISRRETNFRYRVAGRELTRAELATALQSNPDREVRRAAWEARAQLSPTNGDPVRRAIRLRNALSRQYSGVPFADATLTRAEIDRSQLFQWFEEIQVASDAPYRRLIARMREELRVTQVEPWDIDYYFSTFAKDLGGSVFRVADPWPSISRLAFDLSYDVKRLPIEVKVADITFGGATYPILYGREIKILVNKYSGIRFVDTLLHEFGHAIHYAFAGERSFLLLKSGHSEAFDEGLAQVMALMLYRPQVAMKYFGLNRDQACAIADRYRLKSLFDMRETIAESLFELAAYDNPEQDLAALYNRIYSAHLGLDLHGQAVWTFNPFYASEPLYLQNYVLAEMFARQVHHTLQGRFGAQWGKSAGALLRNGLFSAGARTSRDEALLSTTGEALTTKYLTDTFLRSRGDGACP